MPPISKSPLSPVQKAILARLKADAPLVALLGGATKVVDYVPEQAPYPYVRIGDHLSTADNDLTGFGRSITVTIHVWTRYRGNTQGQAIADRIIELLDHQQDALTVVGHRVVAIRCDFDQALTDPDPEIRHHVVRFRVITAQQS